jgi:AcrR family transcriptional regulator
MDAEQRRERVLGAAQTEFAKRGYEATTMATIARSEGVSPPYLFQLFPNKRAVFMATADTCFGQVEKVFNRATAGLTGEAALMATDLTYNAPLDNSTVLRMQLHIWATGCHDTEARELALRRTARLWRAAQRISGADDRRILRVVASGMIVKVTAAVDLPPVKQQLGEALTGIRGQHWPDSSFSNDQPAAGRG